VGRPLLKAFSDNGWEATGVTLSEDAAARLRAAGLNVVAADIREHDFTSNLKSQVVFVGRPLR